MGDGPRARLAYRAARPGATGRGPRGRARVAAGFLSSWLALRDVHRRQVHFALDEYPDGPSIPAPSGQPSSIRLLRLDAEDGSRHARLVAVGYLDDEGDTVLVPWVEHDAVLSEPY